MENYMELKVLAIAKNEVFVRNTVAAFCSEVNPSIDVIADVKTAVSEAISNCIVHAYKNGEGDIYIRANIIDGKLHIEITDNGCGINDINKAMEPYYTTEGECERAGIGFTIMNAFMDDLSVENVIGGGVKVNMSKKLA